jgi:AraC-like DNA-binding protein
MRATVPAPPARNDALRRALSEWWAALETSSDLVVVKPTRYLDGDHVPEHSHTRSQLLYAMSGIVTVTTRAGRWMVPPEHALWLPAGTMHAVDVFGDTELRSVYVWPEAIAGLPRHLHVAALTPLMRTLILAASDLAPAERRDERSAFIMGCLMHEIPCLPERPLGLPFPGDPRLGGLCRAFVQAPSSGAAIDRWADTLGMSRRTFTRFFRRETGLSLSMWRQQASLLAALPRLSAGESVTGVALDLGYESTAAFTTMFRRILGAPPKAYLKGNFPH